MAIIFKATLLLFFSTATLGSPEEHSNEEKLGIFEDLVKKSIECVRRTLRDGIPDLDFPSLDPLVIPISYFNFDIPQFISGDIQNTNTRITGITNWTVQKVKNHFTLVPPTYSVNITMHFDSIVTHTDYEANVKILGENRHSKGKVYSEVDNLVVVVFVEAVIDSGGFHIKQFSAPMTIGKYKFKITGFEDNEFLSEMISKAITSMVPEMVNAHPEISTKIISPLLMYIFDQLVINPHDNAVKRIFKTCVIDILNPL